MATCNGNRTNGQPCHAKAVNGKTKCYKHGGHSLIGRASPRYKHGLRSKYAKFLPGRMIGAYEQSLDDGRMLQLREEIALLDARISDLLTRVDSGESGRLWGRLGQVHGEFSAARSLGKVDTMQEKLAEMEALIAAGKRDAESWREVQGALDLRRKLTESERKRLIDAQSAVTAEQLAGFMTALLELLASEITDRKLLNRLSLKLFEMAAVDSTPIAASSVPA